TSRRSTASATRPSTPSTPIPTKPRGSPMKPGYRTTEFWLTLLAQVPLFLATAGVIPTTDAPKLTDDWGKVSTGVVSAISLIAYIASRYHLKNGAKAAVLFLAIFLASQTANAQGVKQTCLFGNRGPDPATITMLKHISDQNMQILTLLITQKAQP